MSSTTTSTSTISSSIPVGTVPSGGPLTEVTTTFTKGVQYGFFFDQSRCVSCNTCQIMCKQWNKLPACPGKYLRMFEWEDGSFPNTRLNFLFAPCYHCANPVCVAACPTHAIYKEGDYGAVLIDPNVCRGNRQCFEACPYGAVSYRSDLIDPTVQGQKCTMCIDRLDTGHIPNCVASCGMKALDFDTLANLQKKYGTLQQLPGMPAATTTNPSVVFKVRDPKQTLVPYDTNDVLALHQQRIGGSGNPLPNVFASPSDVTGPFPAGLVTHSSLSMKAANVAQAQSTTVNFD